MRTIEMELLILLARINDIENKKQDIIKIIKDNAIDWYKFISYSTKSKLNGMVWKNIKKLKLVNCLPINIARNYEFFYLGNKLRNAYITEEFSRIQKQFNEENVKIFPLKGIHLLYNVYLADMGVRQLNDIDILICKEEISKVEKILNTLGYFQGHVVGNRIEALSRKENIVWKTKMNNLPPFHKVTNDDWCPILSIDSSFSFQYKMDKKNMDKIINRGILKNGKWELDKVDMFLHLCCHLYKEASNATWILLGNDLNLIKFCDIREFIQVEMDKEDMNRAIKRARIYDCQEAVYFSLYYLEDIYKDHMYKDYISIFDISNTEFLHNYGKREFGENQTWRKDFIERLFMDNRDELKGKKEFFNLIENE